MENQVNTKSIILNNGLYFGIVLILAGLIPYAMGMHFEPTAGYINFAAIALVIILFPILGMNKFKNLNNGFMSWGQGVKIGLGIVILGTVISVLYQYVFTTFIEPEFYTQLEEITRKALVDAGLTEEQIEGQLKMQAKFQGTAIGYAMGLLFMTFLGFVSSAIIAAVKKKSEEDSY
ncbi:DUF4199 domain-containing protein [Polaribacter porphyrae]|uniref:DUF4199 domain-containing protein n=1 Tax=Polaribacter porphyrae TaxID=1137780 RepID=A0A2S7WJU4_9FLAO|nr:DUF4199 domain-containing protein [Polaribacter porphyrae]PQJ77706.1 hypothetical protein BTO18_00240 [Polaribacter porphyrae]